jgi:hypothetical protein
MRGGNIPKHDGGNQRQRLHGVSGQYVRWCRERELHELPFKIDLARREFRLVSLLVRTEYISRRGIMYAMPCWIYLAGRECDACAMHL